MTFKNTTQKGNIVKGKLKSQKELKKITSSDKYKKAGYQEQNKMLNVATHNKGGGADMGIQKDKDKISERTRTYALARSMKNKDRLTKKDIKMASYGRTPRFLGGKTTSLKEMQVQEGRSKAKKIKSKLKKIKNQATGFVKEIAGLKHGGSYRGYGAARTPGSQDYGLQDEKLSAGKIYSAKTGKLISK